jgi:hypothetical protein
MRIIENTYVFRAACDNLEAVHDTVICAVEFYTTRHVHRVINQPVHRVTACIWEDDGELVVGGNWSGAADLPLEATPNHPGLYQFLKGLGPTMGIKTNNEVKGAMNDIVAEYGAVSKTVLPNASWNVTWVVIRVVVSPQNQYWVLLSQLLDSEHPSLDKFLKECET